MTNSKAFTLIELLVTIAIIGLLSSIVFASLSTAREKAAVAKSTQEMKQIENAIELSRISTGSYPVQIYPSESLTPSSSVTGSPSLVEEAITEYLPTTIPMVSPVIGASTEADREYIYISNGNEAKDTNNVEYYCDGNNLEPYEIFYKKVPKDFYEVPFTLNDGKLLDEEGNLVVRSKYFSAIPVVWPIDSEVSFVSSPVPQGFTLQCGYVDESSCTFNSGDEFCYLDEDINEWCYKQYPILPYDDKILGTNLMEEIAGYYVCN